MLSMKLQKYLFKSLALVIWVGLSCVAQGEETIAQATKYPWWSKTEVFADAQPTQTLSQTLSQAPIPSSTQMEKRWGVHFKLGLSKPGLGDWSKYYGSSTMNSYQLGVQYFMKHSWSLRSTLSQMTAEGHGTLPSTGAKGADVEITLRPVQLGVVYEFFGSSKSYARPFVSLGYTYASYEQKVTGQQSIKGHTDGTYFGGGFVFNFFSFDRGVGDKGGSNLQNIHWVIDVEKSYLKSNVDLGSLNYQLGLQVKF